MFIKSVFQIWYFKVVPLNSFMSGVHSDNAHFTMYCDKNL